MLQDRLKQLRKAHKLSLQELSKLSGASVSYLHELETGKKANISAEILDKLSGVYKVTKDYLLGKVDKIDSIYVSKEQLPAPLGDYVDGIAILEKAYKAGLTQQQIEEIIEFAIKIRNSKEV